MNGFTGVVPLSADRRALLERLLNEEAARPPRIFPRLDGKDSPLSFSQEHLWLLGQMAPDDPAYHIAVSVRLTGPLDAVALEQSLRAIVCRHDILRTTFQGCGGQVVQVVAAALPLALPVIDLRNAPAAERAGRVRDLSVEEARKPFDLEHGPLLRLRLLRLGEEDHLLLLTVHHIIADGWSMRLLIRELAEAYEAFAAGQETALPDLPLQYADYAAWQRLSFQGAAAERQLAYWKAKLAGVPAALDLPTDRPRPTVQTFHGARHPFRPAPALVEAVRALARRENCTPFMVFLAALQALLQRHSGQDDLCVGTPAAGRGRPEVEGLVGLFVNTLPLRAELSGDPTFTELLARARETCLGAYAHSELPFERLVEELKPQRDPSRTPLFQVLFSYDLEPDARVEVAGLTMTFAETDAGTAKFDLSLYLREGADALGGYFEYNTDLFNRDTAARMAGRYETLLAAAVAEPGRRLSELPILTERERQCVLHEWQGAPAAAPRQPCLHHLFEVQAERTPDATALVHDDERLTYKELNRRANRLAHRLRSLGVGPDELVAVCMDRSADMVTALLGILKAGGAYLPLDPNLPAERFRFILDDAQSRWAVSQPSLADRLPSSGVQCVFVGRGNATDGDDNPSGGAEGHHLAYVLYTSGSTGRPKGVAVEHRNVVNFIDWARRTFGPDELAVVLASTSIGFDLSVFELFAPLSGGGRVVLADDVLALPELPAASTVTLINTVPSALAELLRLGPLPASVQTVGLGGEALPHTLAQRVYQEKTVRRLYNLYGPTETTVYSTAALIPPGAPKPPTIGRPISNTQVYVLDANHRLAPVGVPGELYIGGAGVARGYLRREELTAERFVADPFGDEPGGRLYRTGDLVRWLPDGELEYLGRLDHQLKIRGFRIEPGEIESALRQHPTVRQAVVTAREDGTGDRRLVAYVEADGHGRPCARDLLAHLRGRLPQYMTPSAFVVLDALPLTPNGKIDRRALPAPELAPPEPEEEAGYRSPAEEIVAGAWAEVLGVPRVPANANFFELGGHSLLATRVVARLRDLFTIHLQVRDLFEAPTPAGLTARIEAALAAGDSGPDEPIRAAAHEGRPPLSFAQQRLWFLDQWQAGGAVYNIPAAVRLTGPLEATALEQALQEIVRRHDVLRATFPAEQGQPTQVIVADLPLRLSGIDLESLPSGEREAEARRLACEEARRPFDLARGPLLRATLLRLGREEHVALLVMHHIVSDGWSLGVFLKELAALYGAYASGAPSPLPEPPVQYADYAAWQRRRLGGPALERLLRYWRTRLDGAADALDLPADRPRPAALTHRGAALRFALAAGSAGSVRGLARRQGCTPFMVLLAAFQALLHRHSGQEDICVGTPVAGRGRPEADGLVGLFVNTLVLRADLSGDPTFAEALARARETCLGAYAHAELPFERLVEELRPQRDPGRTPLFQVLLALDHDIGEGVHFPGLTFDTDRIDTATSKFDLSLHLKQQGEDLEGYLEYSTDLFDAGTAERLAGHYRTLLEAAAADPDAPLSRLPLLTPQEQAELERFNDTRVEFAEEHLLHRLIERQAARTPDACAVSFEGRELSYRELDRRASALARRLRGLGVGPDAPVGVCMERSPELVVALLGVLKAGGAYLPLDPDYPTERLALMLKDAAPSAVLAQRRLAGRLPDGAGVLFLDDGGREYDGEVRCGSDPQPGPDDLAYVIYTSGSTGMPKGAMNSHRAICNRLLWMQRQYRLTPQDRVLQKTPFSFDVSVWEFFWPLLAGARIVLARPGGHKDPAYLAHFIQEEMVSVCHFVPSMLRAFLAEPGLEAGCATLREVFCSGEALPYELQQRFFTALPSRLHNLYGPTEAAVDVTYWECLRDDARAMVPIGRPVANTRMHVLDGALRPLPVGVPGELYIGGVQLARGYLNRPELTAERFIEAPGLGRLYRTGDRGRWLADGALEYLGRTDHQVKVRGVRIELGEVEAALAACPGVAEAAAAVRRTGDGDARLVGYVVPSGEGATAAALRERLRKALPEALVPSAFVLLDALPLSPNGKLNRKALPQPDSTRTDDAFVAPRTPTEEAVASVWSDVLGVERVGAHDNFFDLGGHSLLATQVVARLKAIFQTEIPLLSLFENPTVRGLAEDVERRRKIGEALEDPPLIRIMRRGDMPLSFAQERLWFLDQWEPGSPQYNIAAAVRLTGPLNGDIIERSLREILRRHEVLRTTFRIEQGRPVAVVAGEPNLSLAVVDLSGSTEEEARRLACEEARRPFDLTCGPLLRASILRLGPEQHLLLVVMHHIVSDGWSIGVLTHEVAALYGAYVSGRPSPLPEPPIQYGDYAAWQRRRLDGPALERLLGYWRTRLDGAPAALDLPADRPRPAALTHRGAAIRFALPAPLARAVRGLARRQGCTPFMVLLAAFQALLHRLSGQDDICVGTPVAGRGRPEADGLVGLFVNTLVLRADLSGDPTFAEALARARETCLSAYAHAELPFERLVEELRPQRDPARTPLFQVMLVLQNTPQESLQLPGLTCSPEDVDGGTSKFDLTLRLTESAGEFRGELEYSTDLFDAGTAERLAGHYRTLLEAAAADPDAPLSRLPLLTPEEQAELERFNDTRVEFAEEHLLHPLIERQAGRTPAACAVSFEGQELTYRELDRRASALARRLRGLGVGPDAPVGVCMERSPELVVALLGVLKAGGAYLPLDPDYPAERLALMLRDAAPPAVLAQRRLAGRLPDGAGVHFLDDGGDLGDGGEDLCVSGPRSGPDHLAYVIYTSGSTGMPKGAMNSHRAICNRLLWMQRQYRLTPQDRVLQKTPFSFDVSVWEFFWPLLAGARIVLARSGGHKDPCYLSELIREEKVSVCHFVPSMLRAFLAEPGLGQSCATLREVFCSGEALPYELQQRFFTALPSRLHNLYGPTEAAVDVTYWECLRDDARAMVPIGRPVANTRMHVLDGALRPLPVGVPGELYIGGVQLARGYLNRPELTAERFIEAPGLGRLYRTGDRGRWLADGALEYLGRTDHQVKVRGVRIELGEVEAALAACPGVAEAAAAVRQAGDGDARLVGYVVASGEGATAAALRERLRKALPEALVPSAFVLLDALPLSTNGKLDRKALPEPDSTRTTSEVSYVAPEGPVEETLAQIWAEVLGVDRVGAHDNFFDLGGHSLLATQVVSRVRQAFPVEIPLRRLFETPTVAKLARVIRESQEGPGSGQIAKVQPSDADHLLSQLDQLSDEQIDALLHQELAE